MSSLEIYNDISSIDLGEKISKLEKQNQDLHELLVKSADDVERLCNELTSMKKIELNLKTNISQLYNSSKLEIERKDRQIAQLQRQLDDIILKRDGFESIQRVKSEPRVDSKIQRVKREPRDKSSVRVKSELRDKSNQRVKSEPRDKSSQRVKSEPHDELTQNHSDRHYRNSKRSRSQYREKQTRNLEYKGRHTSSFNQKGPRQRRGRYENSRFATKTYRTERDSRNSENRSARSRSTTSRERHSSERACRDTLVEIPNEKHIVTNIKIESVSVNNAPKDTDRASSREKQTDSITQPSESLQTNGLSISTVNSPTKQTGATQVHKRRRCVIQLS